MNMLEQKFIGLGHIFESGDGHHIIVVNHFIEIHTTNRTSVTAGNIGPNGETTALDLVGYYREEYLEKEAEFNTDENGNMIDPFLTGAGPSEYVLEGHTHPDLHVFIGALFHIPLNRRNKYVAYLREDVIRILEIDDAS